MGRTNVEHHSRMKNAFTWQDNERKLKSTNLEAHKEVRLVSACRGITSPALCYPYTDGSCQVDRDTTSVV
ncbi:hypothetical protein RRG08_012305 [Elysia crispata]|uniref:Uncharacterized protein n=1 Tax=Elysia crispata TaxID=231223 RepID=A0AAE1BCG9_9GAST|nr:hypothetical protein RRG08_012305 [Elysia crispata]